MRRLGDSEYTVITVSQLLLALVVPDPQYPAWAYRAKVDSSPR